VAVTPLPQNRIEGLACVGLVTPDAARLSRFYQAALGFRVMADERRLAHDLGPSIESGEDGQCFTLGLGREIVELLQFDSTGRLYPDGASASDLCFQHFAIVVADMAEAYRRLCSVSGWTAISIDGPQRLPPSSGGVSAFKFRDPDGHPLELLAFPDGAWPEPWQARSNGDLALGIDHSAISVSDSARSIAFYESLGLQLAGRSLNVGDEQARLDGVTHPHVEVTALTPRRATPHVELLCYRAAVTHESISLRSNDVAATRLIFEAGGAASGNKGNRQALIDPDGHHLVIVESVKSNVSLHAKVTANAGAPPASAKPE
jgi:catechol 2,3-dioxygenase-like lactoylglutathione lyase family enzyme